MKIPYVRRFLAGFLVICMTLSMFPVVSAEDSAQPCEVCGAVEGHLETCDFYKTPDAAKPTETVPQETETTPATKETETTPATTETETTPATKETETTPVTTETETTPATKETETTPATTETETTPVTTETETTPETTETDPGATTGEDEPTAFEQLKDCTTLAEIDAILKNKDNRAELSRLELVQWQTISKLVEKLYKAIEKPTEEETALNDALTKYIDAQIARFCTECGLADDNHKETCSQSKVTDPVEPTTEPVTEPEETEPEKNPEKETETETQTETGTDSEPTTEPDSEPTTEPDSEPTTEPDSEPTTEPDSEPTTEPDSEPTTEPATQPTTEPATQPTTEPATQPTTEPATETETEAQTASTETVLKTTQPLMMMFGAMPKAAGPTVTASIYTSYSQESGYSGHVVDLTDQPYTLSGWNYTDPRYVNVSCTGLDPNETTTITVKLDKILYFEPIPSDTSFTQNAKLECNANTYSGVYLEENSGTITYTKDEIDELNFPFTLYYDHTLWKRLAGQSLRWDKESPILTITVKNGDTEKTLVMTDAISGINYMESDNGYKRTNVKIYKNDINTHVGYDYDTDIKYLPEETSILQLRSYMKSDGTSQAYFDELRVVIDLPSCEINGQTYYMSIADVVPNDTAYKCSYSVDEATKTATIIFDNIMPWYYVFGHVYLTFPQIDNLQKGTYTFTGRLRMYNGDVEMHQNAKETIDGVVVPRTYFRLVLDNAAAAELVSNGHNHDVYSGVTNDNVNFLGAYFLENRGTKPSSQLTVKMNFNRDNDAVIGVTTVNLMVDPNQKPMKVRCTLMDEYGALVENGRVFEVEVPHTFTKYTSNQTIQLTRSMLPETYRNYYFKTIEYDLGYIPANFYFTANSGAPKARTSPGGFYGYYLKDDTTAVGHTVCETRYEDGTIAVDANGKSLSKTVNTTFRTKKEAYVFIKDCLVNGGKTTEVNAGETFGVKIDAYVDPYPHGTITAIDGLRIGLLLPSTATINESTVNIKTDKGKELTIGAIVKKPMGNGRNFWYIETAPGQPVGYYAEDTHSIPNTAMVHLSFDVMTSIESHEETLLLHDSLCVGTEGADQDYIKFRDIFDLNGNGSTSDYVGGVNTNNSSAEVKVVIRSRDARLQSNEELSASCGTGTSVDIYTAEEIVDYNLTINNNKGGIATNLAYYIQIPQTTVGSASDKIILAGAGSINHVNGTEVKLLYTEDPNLDYSTIKSMDESESIVWSESLTDYSKVTMVKVVTADGTGMINGTETSVSIPLKYSGSDYPKCAGSSVAVNDYAVYTYVQGLKSISYQIPSDDCTITLKHKTAEMEFTLTAAYGEPEGEGATKTFDYATGLSFYNAQNFQIKNLVVNNVELGDFTKDDLNVDANLRYRIDLAMNDSGIGAIVDNLSVGTLDAGTSLKFGFKLTNGDALTDNTTARYVTFDIASDSVTIPVRIIINRELATAGATSSAIKAGKEYLNAGSAKETSISKNSAFTVQFVTPDLSNLYGARTLQFSSALPIGTTIALLDYTGSPRYAYYKVESSVQDIPLISFTQMGTSTTPYAINTRENGVKFNEKILFIVDFSGASSYLENDAYTVKMKIDPAQDATDVEAITSEPMTFNTTGIRGFDASVNKTALNYGDSFTYTYTVTGASNDSKYTGRKLALVISGENLPSDAYLLVNGAVKSQNAYKQFIIPLGDATAKGTFTREIAFKCDSLENNLTGCTLNASLMVSATANADKPMRGVTDNTLMVTYSAVKRPSLKITSMSDRAMARDELANTVTLSYNTKDIPEGAEVTLEIQKKIGEGYTTDATYLESLTNSSGGSGGVYNVKSDGDTLTMKFSQMALETGNYQVLMSVVSNGTVLLEVPYRFVVTD